MDMTEADEHARPDADAILEATRRDMQGGLGKLRIFFGYAAGVGKTYAMLLAARAAQAEGKDVVIGYIEPHARPDTLKLAQGLPVIPAIKLTYRNITLYEPDFDAIARRKPEIVLLDELAHTNEQSMKHPKRYQYLDELLALGINVYTTMNVQHLESLNDIVAEITGVVVHETVPDTVFLDAWQVELVDIEAGSLLERLKSEKIYKGRQARRAMSAFFSQKNLSALRELALRATADRVGMRVELERRLQSGYPVWATSERVLVAVGGSPWSARLVRAAHRLAVSLKAPWIALHVITHDKFATVENRERVRSVLKLAESLGAETAMIHGENSAGDILSFARARNVTKIVAGRDARRNPLLRLLRPSLADILLKEQGGIDVFFVHGDFSPTGRGKMHIGNGAGGQAPMKLAKVSIGTAAIMLTTLAISLAMDTFRVGEANIIMIHLLGAFFASIAYGRRAGLAASLWSVLQFNFFFTEPRLTFAVYDARYIPIFGIMFLVAVMTASLTSRIREQSGIIRNQEARTYQLYLLGQSLAEATDVDDMLSESCKQLSNIYGTEVAIFLPESDGMLVRRAATDDYRDEKGQDASLAWCIANGRPAGFGTDTLAGLKTRYEPIKSGDDTIGILGIRERDATEVSMDIIRLETALSPLARMLEREKLLEERKQAYVRAESERVRSSLLRSVSHDLRTPLSVIAGAAESLEYVDCNPGAVSAIAADIGEEAQRLSLLVENILNLTRLQEDPTKLAKSRESVDDLVYAAAGTARKRYRKRQIVTTLGIEPELVKVDPVLIQQLLLNYVDNADKYSPEGTPIEIAIGLKDGEIRITVRDHGAGVPPELESRIFEKFVRGEPQSDTSRGSGLGLYICDTIAKANGGRVFYERPADGGSIFGVMLPRCLQGKSDV